MNNQRTGNDTMLRVLIPKAEHKALQAIAGLENRTVSAVVRDLIKRALQEVSRAA